MQKKVTQLQDLHKRLEQSERDKQQLKRSIEELNQCYLTKINILQNTVDAYENRIEELLEIRKNQIDKELAFATKYEQENKKLIAIIENLYSTFEEEKIKLNEEIKVKDNELGKVTEERDSLLNKSQDNEQKIDQLVRQHTVEIQKLKRQLLFLKEEVIQGSNEQQVSKQQISVEYEQQNRIEVEKEQKDDHNENALKQITNLNEKTILREQETRIKQLSKGDTMLNNQPIEIQIN